MAQEEIIVRKIDIQTDEAVKSLENVEEAQKDVTASTSDLDNQLNALPGPLAKVQGGLKGISAAAKALLANPLVLVFTAVATAALALGKAFFFTQEGADALNRSLDATKASSDEMRRSLGEATGAIAMARTIGIKNAWKLARIEMEGVRDRMAEASENAKELFDITQALRTGEADLLTFTSERRARVQELLIITRDMTASYEDQKSALAEASVLEKEILVEQLKVQEQRVRAAQVAFENAKGTEDERDAYLSLRQAEATLDDRRAASLAKERELINRNIELDTRWASKRKAIAAEEEAEKQAADQAYMDRRSAEVTAELEQRELDKQFAQDMADFDIEMEQYMADETKKINKELTDELVEQTERRFRKEQQEADRQLKNEQDTANAKRNIYQDSLYALTTFLGEGSKLAKGIQIADATKSAIQGAQATHASVSAIPVVGPVLAIPAAIAALAAGMANVRRIAQTQTPGVSTSSSVPSVSLAAPSVSSANLTNADVGIASDVNIIQDTTRREATKAYVVESEVTAKQEIAKQREADVTLE